MNRVKDKHDNILLCPASIFDLPDEIIIKIKTWYANQVPFREMERRLADAGYQVNHIKLYRFCRDNLPGIANPDGAPIFSQEDHVKLELEVVTDILKICQAVLDDIEIPKIRHMGDFVKFISAVGRLEGAIVTRDRQELVRVGVEQKVRDELLAEVRHLLSGRPDLVQELHGAFEQAGERIAKRRITP